MKLTEDVHEHSDRTLFDALQNAHGCRTVSLDAMWLYEIRAQAIECEARRHLAKYDTGTISEAACIYLRMLTERLQPTVAIEVGTFIGSSTMAIHAGRIYTCDKDNDCVPRSKRIRPFPYTRSTEMLKRLVADGVRADFFFFDGRIKDADERLILALSTPQTVYAFDDYEGREKGVLNVERMRPHLPTYTVVAPPADVLGLPSKTTIAVMVPQ